MVCWRDLVRRRALAANNKEASERLYLELAEDSGIDSHLPRCALWLSVVNAGEATSLAEKLARLEAIDKATSPLGITHQRIGRWG